MRKIESQQSSTYHSLSNSSVKSRQYLDLFIQRVKESFVAKESEASGSDTTRKNEIKNVQESIKQMHANICIFSRAIEQLVAENETGLGKFPHIE